MNTKKKLIQILKEGDGWISGEDISRMLGVSRVAIAKHITSLRNDGYLIEAAPRRGYSLRIIPDEINIDCIKNSLTTKIIGKKEWILLPETRSTNQEAILHAAQGAPEGTIIIAQKQTNGRGRKGKEWFSAPRSIYFSAILRPNISPEKQAMLTTMITVAIHKTLIDFAQLDATIKWPNDILVHGKKIAGTLVETGLIADEIEWVVIGVGCNINTERSEFPIAIQDKVTSVFEEKKQVISRNHFYQKLIEWFDHYYLLLLSDQISVIKPDIVSSFPR